MNSGQPWKHRLNTVRNVLVVKRGQGMDFPGIQNARFYLDDTRRLYGDGQKIAGELIQYIKTR